MPAFMPRDSFVSATPAPAPSMGQPAGVRAGHRHPLAALACVALAHLAALVWLDQHLGRPVPEPLTPAQILVEMFNEPPPEPARTPRTAAPAVTQPPTRPSPRAALAPAARPAAGPVAAAAPVDHAPPTPDPTPPAGGAGTSAAASAGPTTAAAAPPGPPSPPAAPPSSPPSASAPDLNNPKPAYPALSRRLGEQGQVVVRVFVGTDGLAHQAEIRTSSGYDRLDQAALNAVLRWRYAPARRAGVPEAQWFNVPVNFVLE